MSQVRNDIFPNMVPLLETKEKTISGYVDEALEALSSLFKTKEEITAYINSLANAEMAELFLHVSQFYLIAKKYQTQSYIKLIMIISAIENLVSQNKDFQEFHIWIQRQDATIDKELSTMKLEKESFKASIRALAGEYFKIYGSRRNVLDFFVNNLSIENKLRLVRSFYGNRTEYIEGFPAPFLKKIWIPFPRTIFEAGDRFQKTPEKHLMLYCFDWHDCYTQYGRCFPEFNCKIQNDANLLDIMLKRVVADLYQMRNDFVHSARVTPLNEKDSIGMFSVLGSNRKLVSIPLTVEDLQSIFESGLKNYFDGFRTKSQA